jgi:lipoprotein-releasing system permease protein
MTTELPFEVFLALRYLRARRRGRLARATAVAAIAGIAFGVAALITTTAIANGFRDEMRDKILSGTAHVTLMRADGAPIASYPFIVSRLKSIKGVSAAFPTTYNGALLAGPKGSGYAVLRGIDTNSPESISEISRTLTSGTVASLAETSAVDMKSKAPSVSEQTQPPLAVATEPNIIIGAELAARTGLTVGEEGTLISGDAKTLSMGGKPREQRVRVTGIFRSGLFDYDSTWVYIKLDEAAHLAGMPRSASVISIQVSDIYNTSQVRSDVSALMGAEYTTVDWQEANRPLFAALTLERRMVLVLISLITLLAALNITTTLVLLVSEKRSDIAILGAMGARRASIMTVFIIEGAIVGLVGTVTGAVLGIIACALGNHYRLVSLPGEVYSLSNIPFHVHAGDVLLAVSVAFLLSLIATIYPASAAARLRPVEALRES